MPVPGAGRASGKNSCHSRWLSHSVPTAILRLHLLLPRGAESAPWAQRSQPPPRAPALWDCVPTSPPPPSSPSWVRWHRSAAQGRAVEGGGGGPADSALCTMQPREKQSGTRANASSWGMCCAAAPGGVVAWGQKAPVCCRSWFLCLLSPNGHQAPFTLEEDKGHGEASRACKSHWSSIPSVLWELLRQQTPTPHPSCPARSSWDNPTQVNKTTQNLRIFKGTAQRAARAPGSDSPQCPLCPSSDRCGHGDPKTLQQPKHLA